MTFNKDYLYDGPWRVLWKTNTAWQKYFDPLNSVADNRAYQWYKEVRLDIILLCGGCTFDCVVLTRWLPNRIAREGGATRGCWVTLPDLFRNVTDATAAA